VPPPPPPLPSCHPPSSHTAPPLPLPPPHPSATFALVKKAAITRLRPSCPLSPLPCYPPSPPLHPPSLSRPLTVPHLGICEEGCDDSAAPRLQGDTVEGQHQAATRTPVGLNTALVCVYGHRNTQGEGGDRSSSSGSSTRSGKGRGRAAGTTKQGDIQSVTHTSDGDKGVLLYATQQVLHTRG